MPNMARQLPILYFMLWFFLFILIANTNLYLAFYGVLFPSFIIAFIIMATEHPLFKCHSCKQMYAGTRLAFYSRDDNTYL